MYPRTLLLGNSVNKGKNSLLSFRESPISEAQFLRMPLPLLGTLYLPLLHTVCSLLNPSLDALGGRACHHRGGYGITCPEERKPL